RSNAARDAARQSASAAMRSSRLARASHSSDSMSESRRNLPSRSRCQAAAMSTLSTRHASKSSTTSGSDWFYNWSMSSIMHTCWETAELVDASRQLLSHLAKRDDADVRIVTQAEQVIFDSYSILKRYAPPKYLPDRKPSR